MSLEEVRLVVQLALGGVFLVSSLGKLRRPGAFLRGVADYEILPPALAFAFGAALIPAEALLAAAHLSGLGLRLAAPLGTALFLVFAVALAVNLRRNRDLACHCFGSLGDERVSARSLAQLALLVAGEVFVWTGAAAPSVGLATGHGDVGLALVWAVAALLGGLWLLRADELVVLFRRHRCKTCSRPPAGRGAETS